MNKRLLYFAYGSNMNPARAAARIPDAADFGAAVLPDYRIAERLYADIERAPGSCVHGVLYLVTESDLLALDGFEGSPDTYRRIGIEVLFGVERYPAQTYEMTSDAKRRRRGRAYPEDYRRICSEGAVLHGIPDAFAASGSAPACGAATIFVAAYGTLLSGERNASLASDAIRRVPCALTGTLHDTGWGFPAFDPHGDTTIAAELLEVTPETFARLDRLEGYPRLYTRQQLPVTLRNGRKHLAWVYIMNHLPPTTTLIPSGNWRRR